MQQIVQILFNKYVLDKQKCSVPATNDLFGDPCKFFISIIKSFCIYNYHMFLIGFGTVKRLLIQIQCDPPQNNTYYNFTYIDPMLEDFLDATDGHSRIISLLYSTKLAL